MEGNFKKYFRSPEYGLKIRGSGSYTESEIDNIKKHFKEYVTTNYEAKRLSTLSFETELGVDVNEKIDFVFSELIKYFESLGIDNVTCNEFFLTEEDPHKKMSGESSITSGVTVINSGLENIYLKQLVFLKTLAHELYHSTAMASLTIKEEVIENIINRKIKTNSGISYNTENEPLLFEEGMASLFEEAVTPKIKKLFLKETQEQYKHLVQIALDNIDEPELSDEYDIYIKQTNEGMMYTSSEYSESRKVIKYLKTEIEDFLVLVENARINRHTLPLARAIEKKFGKGSYRRITTAHTTEAHQVLKELLEAHNHPPK
jgi:hypothetical protein